MDIPSERLDALCFTAQHAAPMHYGPYSGFCVLCALEVVDAHGRVRTYGGSNVENEAFTRPCTPSRLL